VIDYSETERMFKALMDASDRLMSISDVMEVNDWFNHREYGVALEILVEILSASPVPKEIIQRIKVLAIHMNMTELSLADLVEA
jgi:hypothetical protein